MFGLLTPNPNPCWGLGLNFLKAPPNHCGHDQIDDWEKSCKSEIQDLNDCKRRSGLNVRRSSLSLSLSSLSTSFSIIMRFIINNILGDGLFRWSAHRKLQLWPRTTPHNHGHGICHHLHHYHLHQQGVHLHVQHRVRLVGVDDRDWNPAGQDTKLHQRIDGLEQINTWDIIGLIFFSSLFNSIWCLIIC